MIINKLCKSCDEQVRQRMDIHRKLHEKDEQIRAAYCNRILNESRNIVMGLNKNKHVFIEGTEAELGADLSMDRTVALCNRKALAELNVCMTETKKGMFSCKRENSSFHKEINEDTSTWKENE